MEAGNFGGEAGDGHQGGSIAYAQMGDPNASIPTPQPVKMRPMFGALGNAVGDTSLAFVSISARPGCKWGAKYGLAKKTAPVSGTRSVAKRDMVLNDACPSITVDAETEEVKADGEVRDVRPGVRGAARAARLLGEAALQHHDLAHNAQPTDPWSPETRAQRLED